MLSNRFAEAYTQSHHPVDQSSETDELLAEADRYDHWFGGVALGGLTGAFVSADEARSALGKYKDWADRQLPGIETSLGHPERREGTTQQIEAKAEISANRLNFHRLNRHLSPLWFPLITGEWPTPDQTDTRAQQIFQCQKSLAFDVLRRAQIREELSTSTADFAYFKRDYLPQKNRNEQYLHTADTALVILEWIKRSGLHNLTTVAAPTIFHSNPDRTKTVSLLLSTKNNQTVGIDVFSWVTNRTFDRQYDKDLRVPISGRFDLGNQIYRHTSLRASGPAVQSWGGLISLEWLSEIDTLSSSLIPNKNDKQIAAKAKASAIKLRNSVSPWMDTAVNRISDRLQTKIKDSQER